MISIDPQGGQPRRRMMIPKYILAALFAAGFVLAFGVTDSASAKHKKVSYDQAWKICKDQMDKGKIPGTSTQSNERYTRGAGCMKKYGYRI
jgi:hypothetical protein